MLGIIEFYLMFATVVGALLVIGWLAAFSFAYHHLARRHPAFYKRLGEPVGPLMIWSSMSRQAKGWNYMTVWVDRGVPSNFPKDKICRQLVKIFKLLKRFFVFMIVVWGVSALIIAIFAVQSGIS